jgi:hypothetical protein
MEKRKILDELLQTNVGITENLKNGIFTLSPLVSGLMASLGMEVTSYLPAELDRA